MPAMKLMGPSRVREPPLRSTWTSDELIEELYPRPSRPHSISATPLPDYTFRRKGKKPRFDKRSEKKRGSRILK